MEQKLEILVATMHQKDFSKIEEMNIRCDVVFANQADRNEYAEQTFDGHRARMITTTQRGVGKNRNLALLYATGDYLLMGDDDMIYANDCPQQVVRAFEELPDADVIVFDVAFLRDGACVKTGHYTGPLPFRRSGKYGTYAFAARRESLQKANIWFHTQFGGGTPHSSGEDSLFLADCYRRGLQVYTHSYVIGRNNEGDSTWFKGFTEKYFIDKGCWLSQAMPRTCRLAIPALALKWKKLNPELGWRRLVQLMNQGVSEFRRK